jgi:hypothetical protein
MRSELKARPTEYKGVVYRSKSEALFARWLELREEVTGFVYEPDFPLEEWSPDFLFWSIRKPSGYAFLEKLVACYDKIESVNWSLPSLSLVYVEYKPAMPTQTYLDRWVKVCDCYTTYIARNSNFFPDDFRFELYVGGFYNTAVKIIAEPGDYHEDEFIWLTDEDRELCLDTRFDLEVV